jgi:dolichol-phosphate mannosyltransferase
MMSQPEVSVILPVKDEPYLSNILIQLAEHIQLPYEVKVQTEKGLGNAVKLGIEKARGSIIVIMDSDGSHNPKYLPIMIHLIRLYGYDIVIGSRYTKNGNSQDSFSRKIISKTYCKIAKTLFKLNVKDNMSGFIVAKKEAFTRYPIDNNGYKIGLELLVKSKKTHQAIEYPITFLKRQQGKSKANYKQGIQTLYYITKLYWKQKP